MLILISDFGLFILTPKRALNIKNNDTCNNIIGGTVVRMRKSGKQNQLHMVKSKKLSNKKQENRKKKKKKYVNK